MTRAADVGALVAAVIGTGCSRAVPSHDAVNVGASAPTASPPRALAPPALVAAGSVHDASSPSTPSAPRDDLADARAAGLASVRRYKAVLLAGDSMVGARCCLSTALASRFQAEGSRFVSDAWSNVTTAKYDHDTRFTKLIRATNPDLIVISLGTNDVFVPHPEALGSNVASIAKKAGARDCYWIGPPTWRGDTGIVEVIRRNAAPCKFFDSSGMNLERIRDGVHVTDSGGAEWASQFWKAFRPTALP